MPEFTTLIGGLSFTECPRWHDGRLYVSDFFTHRVLAISLDGQAETIAHVPAKPAGLGFLPDGRLLIACKGDRRLLCREFDGTLVEYADLSSFAQWDLNDMLVDNEGRAWVGNFGFDLAGGAPCCTTRLICVEPDGSARIASDALGFPNGTVLTPDGATMIIAESISNRLSAFAVFNGQLGPRRTWGAFGPEPTSTEFSEIICQADVVPDGICLDAQGAVWVADVTHKRVIRVAEGGAILADLPTNGLGAFACMLGGEDRRTLFVCAAPSFREEEASAHHRATILMTRVEIPGAGLP